MRVGRWPGRLLLPALILTSAGCHGIGSKKAAAPETTLSGTLDSGAPVVEAPPAQSTGYVDRHPILYKPRDYWDDGGNNKVVKAARATFIGVPSGIYNEMKQIVVGAPPEPAR
ncbi:hypothetical protein [Aquisphaera insulae]|uniref:hypothetical protein n=1 Tax=Aquisphaera insulae TaxID=2712864 RepID=UPI0013EB989C|nr:hypothetical protein [Aquisphaera insulae]